MWDRMFGGTTLVIHVDGTTRPGSPRRPEFVKTDVYFPGHLLRLNDAQRYSDTISDMVQRFIIDIGLPTIERYERCAKRHWPLTGGRIIPLPYPQQGTQPPAVPPNSSTFVYHGRPSILIVDSDSDDDFAVLTSRNRLSTAVEVESLLKKELDTVKANLRRCQEALAESRQHEQDLLAQVDRLTNASGSTSLPAFTMSVTSHSVPQTPDRVSPHRNLRSPNIWISPFSSFSPVATPSRHAGASSFPAFSCGADHVKVLPNIHTSPSPVKPSSENSYKNFIHVNDLDDAFAHIDLICRTVAPYMWRDELGSISINGDKVTDLMAVMAAYSLEIESYSGTSTSSPL